MSLSTTRQQVLLNGQTNVAKKVFQVVPIQEAWTAHAIQQAFYRATRSMVDFRILQGCLNTLKQAGLICEPSPAHFERIKTRETIEKMSPKSNDETAQVSHSASVDMLAELAERARTLAIDLDAAADAIAEEHASNAHALQKLESLRALLKNLS